MLDRIFDFMFSSGFLRFFGVFLWGIASVILSPCGISAVPLVIGYIENTDNPSRLNSFKISCAFCLGIILNLALVAFVMSSLGVLFGGYERFLTLIVALIFIIMGLQMTGIIHLKFFSFGNGGTGNESQNLKGAIILGIVSGLAIGPCSIAYVSPILSLAMSEASKNFLNAIFLILFYALGYSFVLILSGTFAQLASEFLQNEKGNKILKILNIICGVSLFICGIYLLNEMRYLV